MFHQQQNYELTSQNKLYLLISSNIMTYFITLLANTKQSHAKIIMLRFANPQLISCQNVT